MKNIKNVAKFAREQGESPQVIQNRIKSGWVIGMVEGVESMYNPANVHAVKYTDDTQYFGEEI